jgi:hypothetical protein
VTGLGKTLEAIAVVMLHPRINTQIVSATLREDNDVKPTLFELESVEIAHAEGSQTHAGKRRRLDDGEAIAIDTRSSVQPFRGSTHWDDYLKVNITEVKVRRAYSTFLEPFSTMTLISVHVDCDASHALEAMDRRTQETCPDLEVHRLYWIRDNTSRLDCKGLRRPDGR